jgi:hypothetical protein
LALRVQLPRDLSDTGRRLGDRLPPIRCVAHRLPRSSRRGKYARSRDIRLEDGFAQHARIDRHHFDSAFAQQIANESEFRAFRVQCSNQQHGHDGLLTC